MSSLEKALSILNQLTQAPYTFSLGELAEAAGCGKSGAFKLLQVLMASNYVQQDADKRYSLGFAVSALMHAYEKTSVSWAVCRPILEELRNATGETATIAKWDSGTAHILFRVRSHENLRVEGNLGKRLPLNASAHGKLLGAFQNPQHIARLIELHPLERLTEHTIVDVPTLQAQYVEIRKNGYVVSTEESSLGAVGISAPVRGADGDVCASLCVGTPLVRMTPEKKALIIREVKYYANQLTNLLQSRGSLDN